MSLSGRFTSQVRPDPAAQQLAEEMLAMEATMRDILDETIPAEDADDPVVRESGRTLCGSTDIHGPLARFPTAVELAACPRGVRGGTWHSHVTRDQLQAPSNSLPDTANVIFGHVDVSIVVGTRRAEAVVAPDDEAAGVTAFQDAIGAEVETTEGVVDAILDGRIAAPGDARRRVRSRLGDLFMERSMRFNDLDARIERGGIPAASVASFEMAEAQRYHQIAQGSGGPLTARHPGHSKHPIRDPQGVRQFCRKTTAGFKQGATRVRLGERVADVAITETVGRAVRALLP